MGKCCFTATDVYVSVGVSWQTITRIR